MMILSINFGHDASLSLFNEKGLISFQELERISRFKHHTGIASERIVDFIELNNTNIKNIKLVLLTGTQWYKFKHCQDIELRTCGDKEWAEDFNNYNEYKKLKKIKSINPLSIGGTESWYDYESHKDDIKNDKKWVQTAMPLDYISDAKKDTNNPEYAIYKYIIKINKYEIPAIFLAHHFAHAYYAAYYRNEKNGYIFSHDGGWPHILYNSGGLWKFNDDHLQIIQDPKLFIGQLYQRMGERAGFKRAEAPGKLMGLASYGVANEIMVSEFVLKIKEIQKNLYKVDSHEFEKILNSLIDNLLTDNRKAIKNPIIENYSLSELNIDCINIAATTQSICERVYCETVSEIIKISDLNGYSCNELILTGGYTLNCPSTSKLHSYLPQYNIVPLAGCADMGISIGAGVYAYKLIYGKLLKENGKSLNSAFPPKKNKKKYHFKTNLIEITDQINYDWLAKELINGKIICIHDGKSELGPRALGNRSIIGLASYTGIRDKINKMKGRERWRPLAPMVLEKDFTKYFYPLGNWENTSQCMLLTYGVKAPFQLPEITHVDFTARVQVAHSILTRKILNYLKKNNAIPVIINTSFNVAGEPLVENENEAANSFKNLGADYLIMDNKLYR